MKKIPAWKNVILIVSALVIIVIATFAWFYTGNRGSAEELQVHVGKATYVQVSGDQGNNWAEDWDSEIGINDSFKEISGDGTTFYAPNYEVVGSDRDEEDSVGYSTAIVKFEKLSGYDHCYEKIFDLRSDVQQDVYLSAESFVTAVGNESFIDGAIRVAFYELDEQGNETLKFIWAPNSTVEFSGETNSFTRDGSVEPYYYYQKSTTFADPSTATRQEDIKSHVAVIATEGAEQGFNQTYKFMWSNGQLPSNAPAVVKLDIHRDDGHYYKQVKIRVWLEGHDRECVSLVSGQKFTMKLQFTAQEVE